nr:hypothetical protein [Tanacetum cinerariifolium]
MALNNAQTKTNSSAFRMFLKQPCHLHLPAGADAQALADWAVLFYRHNEVACLMLGTMSPKLYQQFQHNSPLEMVTELKKKMYGKPPGVELQELVNMFHSWKGKGPQNSYPTKPKKPQPYKKERPAKDGQCHHCKEEGHWKRNCHVYLAELMKKKKTGGQNVASTSSGSIMYAVRCTRPDVAFAQNITSRFQENSGEAHWTAVKNILKYLRNTKDTFLVYGGDPEAELRVNCYCDAGFETDRDDTKSQTGKFIDELGVVPSNDYSIKMNCDKSAAIIMAKESGIQKGTKHFKRKYHYVHECIETGEIDIVKVHTDDNLADPFTKALAGPKLTRHARSMGLHPASSFM